MLNYKNFVRELEEGNKEEYTKFVKAKLEKFGVKSPADLKGADKKKFYDEIDAEWESDDEEDGIEEYITRDGIRRRCSGGDGRRRSVKARRSLETEEGDDCGDDEEEQEENIANFGDKKAKPFKDDDEKDEQKKKRK